jgi:histidinol-phosphate/aromatic aminotransferase/cobyric acid decarboxylase-like protein
VRRPRFLDYYRQFEALSNEESSRRLKARRDAERSKEIELAPAIDLSRPDWHEPPDPEIVNAATFALRRAINRYPDAAGGVAREALAARHGVPTERVALGHGAAQLIQASIRRLGTGGSVLLPWPSWSPLPALVARTGARPVLVECPEGPDPSRIAAAAAREGDVRAVVLCSPSDPTGALVGPAVLRELSEVLPGDAGILLDEALVDFAGEEASAVGLTDEIPALLVFRSFSKAWALAGLRAGSVVGAPDAAGVLTELTPGLGVSAPAQAAMAAAVEPDGRPLLRLTRRAAAVAAERRRLADLLRGSGFQVHPSDAHLVWLAHPDHEAHDLVHALAEQRIAVAPGSEWGDGRHIRVTLRDRAATERLASGLLSIQ